MFFYTEQPAASPNHLPFLYRPNPADSLRYNALVKDVRKLVKKTRNEYYTNALTECHGDKKKQFKLFDKMLGKNDKKLLPEYDDKQNLCEEFQNFFCEKIERIRDEISVNQSTDSKQFEYTHAPMSGNLLDSFTPLTDDLANDTIQSLPNKYCCLDVIPTDIFKKCIPYLLPYLKFIINKSLETGIFPSKYKDTIVKPLIKQSTIDKELHGNYRPLSNLCFISKVIERSVLNQLVEHLEGNHLFGEFQSAYRKFHSCETAITKITNDVFLSLDNKECSFILFLDLSSAFDTIDRDILLSLLKDKYGIAGLALKWIESYLTNRNCFVNIDECFSSGFVLFFGVPQGSILGPILFILYISEIENIAKWYGFKIHIYTFPFKGVIYYQL